MPTCNKVPILYFNFDFESQNQPAKSIFASIIVFCYFVTTLFSYQKWLSKIKILDVTLPITGKQCNGRLT